MSFKFELSGSRPELARLVAVCLGGHQCKQAAAHSLLPQLLEAKQNSDAKRYDKKNRFINQSMRRHPDDWEVDSDNGKGIVGVTHLPTGFRFHTLKHQVLGNLGYAHTITKQADLRDLLHAL